MLRRMWLVVGALLIGFAFVQPAGAQTGKLTGVITDASTGAPLSGVQVVIEGTGRGNLTAPTGRYFILNIPPGIYTIAAQLIGYGTVRKTNVQVSIDATNTVNFALASQAVALEAVTVQAQRVPLIEVKATGSGSSLSADEITALPTSDLAGVLRLQNGFLPVPDDNSDIVSYNDAHRSLSPISIRGGRGGETLTLLDGLPINNVLFGGPSFDITTLAIQQIDLNTGGFKAQYGNMLSGVINQATKEGSKQLQGSFDITSSGFAGSLGSKPDDVRQFDQYQGYVSGPVPGTKDRLRYLVSGRQSTGASRTLEFDDQVISPTERTADALGRVPYYTDLIPGWQGVGFSTKRDLYTKLTFYFTPSLKLNLGGLSYESASKPYNREFFGTDKDFLALCSTQHPNEVDWCKRTFLGADVARQEDLNGGSFLRMLPYMVYNAYDNSRNMFWGKADYTFKNSALTIAAGRLDQNRLACNWLSGVCLGDDIRNYTTVGAGFFVPRNTRSAPRANFVGPSTGSENFFGSDTMHTNMARVDFQSQISEHHNIKTGINYNKHDFILQEARNVGRPFDDDEIARYTYSNNPTDMGAYIQDRIEFDFLTVDLGVRLDHFKVPGSYFTNPLDPTNGTTAFEVCNGTASALGATTPFSFKTEGGPTFTGIAACSLAIDATGNDFLMDSARAVAFRDDFSDIKGRTEISPRIGFSFPVTESVRMYANYGRFTQNPLYHNLLTRTGIGRTAEKDVTSSLPITVVRNGETLVTDKVLRGDRIEGTPLGPDLRALSLNTGLGLLPLVGNPRLQSERTTSYEIGLLAEVRENYALSAVAYSKDQTGLTGQRRGGVIQTGVPINDPGETYGTASPAYYVLVNTDYQTVRGFEMRLRRGLKGYWGFDASYSYSQAWTNAAPPDLEIQKIYEGDPPAFTEIRSQIDLPQVASFTLRFAAAKEVPDVPIISSVLRNTRLTLTGRHQSGFAYTPAIVRRTGATTILDGDRSERNSGTAPSINNIDMYAEKAFRIANLRYSAVVSVLNLFDMKNCAFVYPTSGRCDAGNITLGRGGISGFQNGSPGAGISVAGGSAFSSFQDNPQYFGIRRQITAGLKLSF